jgi:hypothetical protein
MSSINCSSVNTKAFLRQLNVIEPRPGIVPILFQFQSEHKGRLVQLGSKIKHPFIFVPQLSFGCRPSHRRSNFFSMHLTPFLIVNEKTVAKPTNKYPCVKVEKR